MASTSTSEPTSSGEARRDEPKRIIISRAVRHGKVATLVFGLRECGFDVRRVSKFFGKKFGCSSYVEKDGIVVHKDVKDSLLECIPEDASELDTEFEKLFEDPIRQLSTSNIVLTEPEEASNNEHEVDTSVIALESTFIVVDLTEDAEDDDSRAEERNPEFENLEIRIEGSEENAAFIKNSLCEYLKTLTGKNRKMKVKVTCSKLPEMHFGAIEGIVSGMLFTNRESLKNAGVHDRLSARMCGKVGEGVVSILVNGLYDEDFGDEVILCSQSGKEVQKAHQKLERLNKALASNCPMKVNPEVGGETEDWRRGKPVRVVRSSQNSRNSIYAPKNGFRYDGIYKVKKYFQITGHEGFRVWKFVLIRDDPEPAPWKDNNDESKVISSCASSSYALDENLIPDIIPKNETRLQNIETRPSKFKQDLANQDAETGKEEEAQKSSKEIAPITREMKKKLNSILTSSKSPLIQINDICVKLQDIETLKDTTLLNDTVINAYMNLIKLRSEENPTKYPKVHCFNTFLYKNLCERGYKGVQTWTKKVDIFHMAMVIVPVHVERLHHWCILKINTQQKSIVCYNSLKPSNNDCFLDTMLQYLVEEYQNKKNGELDVSHWTLKNEEELPEQKNGYDCGVFTCAFAEHLTRNSPLNFDQKDMPYFRTKIQYEILTGKLLL